MKKITCLLLFFTAFYAAGQIQGKITNTKGEALSFVSVYLNKTLTGTTSNDNGDYLLNIKKKGNYTVVFQFIGFKTVKKNVNITSFPFTLNAQLTQENIILDEISISTKDNPANAIIRNVIANKEKNTNKSANYAAKFYSRGLYKIKDAPEKFLGESLGDFGGGLDSTRSGIIYLSETVSEIKYQKKPKKFTEKIIASKVSGRDNGISFNRAAEANINFYENSINFGNDLISPISNNAFSYYNYKLEGGFYDKNGKLINKILLIPKRKNDRVFEGYLYIVEEDWAIYGADVTVSGEQVNLPMVKFLKLKQDFNYSDKNDAWVLISQSIGFKVDLLGFKVDGKFSSAYSNYNFSPNYTEKTFTNEVLSFEKNATQKDSVYWHNLRPVPLTQEEKADYTVKDSIKVVRKTKKYLDSLDLKTNKFNLLSPITGYTFRNSHKKWAFSFDGIIGYFNFNTVQGFNSTLGFNYRKRQNDAGKKWNLTTKINYGFSDKRLRPAFFYTKNWNNYSRPSVTISGGVTTPQFNNRNPISNLDNTVQSLLRQKNYLKIYEKSFAKLNYSEEIKNGIYFNSSLEYAHRKPLLNTTDYSFVTKDLPYRSNNPLNETDFTNTAFNAHKVWIANIGATIIFNQKYLSYPNQKFNLGNNKYPSLNIQYRKIIGVDNSTLSSDAFLAVLKQDLNAGNYGEFSYNLRGGKFLKKKNIAFMDNFQVKGNQVLFPLKNSHLDRFGLLDYYTFFSNDAYAEAHWQHNFKGAVLGKIPLFNKLNLHLVAGSKALLATNRKPYSEYSLGIKNIGFGKWRFLRVDYVHSQQGSNTNNGFLFGLSLFQ
ncbi:DUF5686 and carboxypeptidase regulatory-like domain-containing protein [Polaribacter sp.]|uniref:DUF5686 and carboxypeptidase regulatory-like domain-containing protein n=1 Tax=Polaribacter sp. TaxID=1920175 RepID=UPI003EF635CB